MYIYIYIYNLYIYTYIHIYINTYSTGGWGGGEVTKVPSKLGIQNKFCLMARERGVAHRITAVQAKEREAWNDQGWHRSASAPQRTSVETWYTSRRQSL